MENIVEINKVRSDTASKDLFLILGKEVIRLKKRRGQFKKKIMYLGNEKYCHMMLWMLEVHIVSRTDKLRKEKLRRVLNGNILFHLQEFQSYKFLETGSILWGILTLHFLFEYSLDFCWHSLIRLIWQFSLNL